MFFRNPKTSGDTFLDHIVISLFDKGGLRLIPLFIVTYTTKKLGGFQDHRDEAQLLLYKADMHVYVCVCLCAARVFSND